MLISLRFSFCITLCWPQVFSARMLRTSANPKIEHVQLGGCNMLDGSKDGNRRIETDRDGTHNRIQPQHNRVIHASYACGSDHSEIPHGAGLQLNDINVLVHTADFKTKSSARSIGYVRRS
jgi:hypothetical protein